MGIKDIFGHTPYLANYVGGPDVPQEQQTASIYVGLGQFRSFRLLDLERPYIENVETTFKLGKQLYYTRTGKDLYDQSWDPLVLDLNGDGVHLTWQSVAAPMFDMKNTGFAVHTGWVQSDDGILVHDANGNGAIDNASEMFGGPGAVGFAALAQDDDNSDGVIDASDAIYSQLQVWRDLDGNAQVDQGELQSLADLGIASIAVAATRADRRRHCRQRGDGDRQLHPYRRLDRQHRGRVVHGRSVPHPVSRRH